MRDALGPRLTDIRERVYKFDGDVDPATLPVDWKDDPRCLEIVELDEAGTRVIWRRNADHD